MSITDDLRRIRKEIAALQEQERAITREVERIIFGCRSVSGYPSHVDKVYNIQINDDRVKYVYRYWDGYGDSVRSICFPTEWLGHSVDWCRDQIREIQRKARAEAEIERIKEEAQKQVEEEEAERALLAKLKAKYGA